MRGYVQGKKRGKKTWCLSFFGEMMNVRYWGKLKLESEVMVGRWAFNHNCQHRM